MSNLGTNNSNCPQLTELYNELKTLKSSFDADLTRAYSIIKTKDIKGANTAITKAKAQRREMEKIIYEIQETIIPLDKLMNFNEQYETQKSVLTELGDLVKLSNGKMVIKGIDPTDPLNSDKTKDYVFPTKEAIRKILRTKFKELYQLKINQGFTRLLVTPFALPLKKMADKYGAELKENYRTNENKLYTASPDPYNPNLPLTALRANDPSLSALNIDNPICIYDDLKQADINGSLKYYPKEFIRAKNGDCGGRTKLDIIKDPGNPFPGFKITLMPQNPIITNTDDYEDFHEALKLTKTEDPTKYYFKVIGQTPEDALNLHRQTLRLTKQVLGDYKGNDKVNYCISAYLDGSGYVPFLNWCRDDRQAYLDGDGPGIHRSINGFRPVVGVL